MWVVAALVSLAVLIILALCVPVHAVTHIDIYGRPRVRMRLVWLFGLVRKEIRKKKKKTAEEKPGTGELIKRARATFQILQTRGLPGRIMRLSRDLLCSPRIGRVRVNLRVGLDNPADTGLLFAFIGPATLFLNRSFPNHIELQPSFDEAVIEGYLHGTVRLRPLQLIPPLLRFAFSLPVIKATKTLFWTKWKTRK